RAIRRRSTSMPAGTTIPPGDGRSSGTSPPSSPGSGADMADVTHLIGLLLGTEDDWPSAFEALVRRSALAIDHDGAAHRFATERITNEPFDLRAVPRYGLVIDRLAHWYDMPREWLKKIALMDDVYLMNS